MESQLTAMFKSFNHANLKIKLMIPDQVVSSHFTIRLFVGDFFLSPSGNKRIKKGIC